MTKLLLISLVAIAVPLVVGAGGGWLMKEVSGRRAAEKPNIPSPLQSRFLRGYDLDQATKYWDCLGPDGRLAERRLLQFDLLYAVLYSAAFAFSIWLAWTKLDAGFSVKWVLVPVVFALLADWIETSILLCQLNQFIEDLSQSKEVFDGLRPHLITIASIATRVKWTAVVLSGLTLVVLLTVMLFKQVELMKARIE